MSFFFLKFVNMNVLKSIGLPSVVWPTWERNIAGDNFYDVQAFNDWTKWGSNLQMAQNHPIATPAILFVSKVFSQATFSVERKSTGKNVSEHSVLDLLRNPNPLQTREDFLESLMFIMIAQGVGIVWAKTILGFSTPRELYVLDKDKIEWPEKIKKGIYRNWAGIMNESILYDRFGENIFIQVKDLLFFYDLPNHLNKNPFDVKSRLDGLRQTLINTQDSLIAKNIILKSNGKELITGKKEGFLLDPNEKKEIESLWNDNFGLAFNRRRGVITKADITWQSMHIALRDLGLDESIKVDGNLVYTALHIPKDILSLEAKKTTYNNFKESMVSYIQNEIQASLNSFVAVLQKLIGDNYILKGSYEHMPIMQFILIERYDGVKKQGEALQTLRSAGIPDDIALESCGFDRSLTLNPLVNNGNQGQQQEQNSSGQNGNN